MAMVPVVQREWVAKHPRANVKTPITVEDMLNFADDRLPASATEIGLGRAVRLWHTAC
jgi:hypothetical protein